VERAESTSWIQASLIPSDNPGMASIHAVKSNIQDIAARLWETADELRANSHLKAAEY
jgi:hypothetical protein